MQRLFKLWTVHMFALPLISTKRRGCVFTLTGTIFLITQSHLKRSIEENEAKMKYVQLFFIFRMWNMNSFIYCFCWHWRLMTNESGLVHSHDDSSANNGWKWPKKSGLALAVHWNLWRNYLYKCFESIQSLSERVRKANNKSINIGHLWNLFCHRS